MLDESDLQEMWDDRSNTEQWLNVVKLNGWAALEGYLQEKSVWVAM